MSEPQTQEKRAPGATVEDIVRCPDCIDGPIPGCQWDYDHQTEWRWKTCPTCDGSGKVSTANAPHQARRDSGVALHAVVGGSGSEGEA